MPQVQYPFIDIAVHPAVRARFAAGEAIALFSRDMKDVLWANGEGARLFGYSVIYDLLENGPDRNGVAFRQLAATAAQLATVGDRRGFMMRITSGFRSTASQAEVTLVEIDSDAVVMFSSPVAGSEPAHLKSMLEGFDDPDTHMAVLDRDGAILAASSGFGAIGITQDTVRGLISAVSRSADGLVKRPVPSGSGYLPAAIGRLSGNLHLIFCVETSLGRMDAPDSDEDIAEAKSHDATPTDVRAEALAAIAGIEEPEDELIETDLGDFDTPAAFLPASEDVDIGENDLPSVAAEDETEGSLEHGSLLDIEPGELAADTAEAATELEQAPEDFAEVPADIDEGEDAGAIADLAAIDGASEEQIEATSAELVEESLVDPDAQVAAMDVEQAFETTGPIEETQAEGIPAEEARDIELAADIAEAYEPIVEDQSAESLIETDAAPVELDADIAEAAEAPEQAPEDFVEAQAVEPVHGELEPEETGFTFNRGGRPVRFVWKLDASGNFSEVSEEFARAVGPNAGDINGQSFRDLANLFALDPDGEIIGLLDRRDTWSGRTIKWPVEGTDLVVPVDLAALPTYSRNREFDGFRGFGIIRVADAEQDSNAFGMRFVEKDDVASADDVPLTVDGQFSEPVADEPVPTGQDEFRGEVPALNIVSNPLAAFSDKIIQLEERRAKTLRDGLSATEQAALKEIARQLEPFGKRPNEQVVKSTSGLLQDDDIEDAEAIGTDAGEQHPDTAPIAAETETEQAFDAEAPEIEFAGDEPVSEIRKRDGRRDEAANDDEVQELFEDLGAGPGLTSYATDQVPMAILIHAGDHLIHANTEFKRLTGYADIEALGNAGGLDALITRREGPDAGVYLVRSDGTQVLVSARLQSVRYEGSSALMLALTPAAGTLAAAAEPEVIGESDAARKLAALKVEVDELRSILETATDGVVVLDTDGRIRSMNRSASALFNFDNAETRGKPFAMLFAHESQKSVQDYLAGLSGHGVASVLNDGRELIGREASGGFIPLFMTMGRMPGSNTYCAVIRDITQWKRSEEELKTAKRAAETANQHKSDFLARVSHEIRTPLNAIIGFSDMIASEHFGPAGHTRYVEYAGDIGRSGRHVLDIVNDLLDISKIEAGEMDLEFVAVGINDCVSEAVSLVQPQANTQRVIIRTSLSQSVPDVVADLRSIKQIAINILANAIRYTPSGGQIVVSTAYEPSGAVTLRIRDTGIGMSKAELDQAMKPFGQVSSGTRQRGEGTGLGLPLTKAMTEANRASFAIHSARNEGTLVEITFPPQRVLAD